MAGAEGIEPSARGFGVDVGKVLHRNTYRPFQPLAGFRRFVSRHSDAFLMLLPEKYPQSYSENALSVSVIAILFWL